MPDDPMPTEEELLDALESPGPLADHPAVQRLLAAREAQEAAKKPKLTLIEGGRDAS